MRFFLRFQEKNQQTRIFPKMDSFALSILLSYPFRGNLSSSIFRSNSLRFACPLGKLQMQFMPFPSNIKKTAVSCGNFSSWRPHGDCARGLVLLYKIRAVSALATLGSFCECKKPPSQAVASRHLRRRTPRGSHPVGIQKSPQTLLFAWRLSGDCTALRLPFG